MYPYACHQTLTSWKAYADALFSAGRFDIGIKAAFGGGALRGSDRLVDADSGVQTEPFRLQEWYDRQMEYLTALRSEAGLSLRYDFPKGIYLQAEGYWIHGFGLSLATGSDRLATALRIGLSF